MIHNSRSGFTLIELLVTLALASIVAVAGITLIGGYNAGRNMKSEGQQFASALQNAQQNSKGQQNGARWGVHVSDTTSTQSYQLFSGLSYASGTIANTYSLRNGIQFGNPSVSSTIDTIFDPITGYLPSPQVFTLNDGKGDGLMYDIAIDKLGRITSTYDAGLVGYWHFDENTSSTAYDASGMGNNGQLQGSPTWATGSSCEAGSCLSFNGTNQYVDVGIAGSINITKPPFSIAAWIDPSAFQTDPDYSTIFTKANSYYFHLDGGGKLAAYIYGASPLGYYLSNVSVQLNLWSFVVLTYDGSNISFYINGQQNGVVAVTGGITPSTSHAGIGANLDSTGSLYSGYSRRFKGMIDEVRIYNRALSAQEVQNIYNASQ